MYLKNYQFLKRLPQVNVSLGKCYMHFLFLPGSVNLQPKMLHTKNFSDCISSSEMLWNSWKWNTCSL